MPEQRSAGIEELIFLDTERVLSRVQAFSHAFDFVSYSPQLGAEGQDSEIPH